MGERRMLFYVAASTCRGTPTKIDEGIPITSFELSIEWVSPFG
jgi:hypothetical protein